MTGHTCNPLPDISTYLHLIDRFLNGAITAPEFEDTYLRAIKSERRIIGGPVFPILQTLFEDADAYVENVDLRNRTLDGIGDEELLSGAVRARSALRDLGYE